MLDAGSVVRQDALGKAIPRRAADNAPIRAGELKLPDGRIVPLPARGPTHTSKRTPDGTTSAESSDESQGNLFDDNAA